MENNHLNQQQSVNASAAPQYAPQMQPPRRRPMEKFPITKGDFRMALAAILWTYVAFLLTLGNGMALGFMLTYLSGFILFTVYFYQKGKTVLKPFETICGALAVCTAPMVVLTGNGTKVLLTFLSFACCIIWFASLCGKQERATDAGLIPHVVTMFFGNAFGALGRSMGSLFSSGGEKHRHAWLWKAMIGLAVSLPITGILLLLLTSADQAFSDLVQRIVENIGEQILRMFLALLFSPFLFAFALGLKKKAPPAPKQEKNGGIEFPYVTAFLGLVSAVYLLYLFSQFAYFFNGFAGILPKGVLPADYARKGFFELCTIAAINFVMLFLVLLFTMKKETRLPAPVKWESAFICLFTLVLIATVFSKMILYINLFGLTQLRVYTMLFMAFMAVVFIALLVRLFVRKVRVLRIGLVTAMCLLLALSLCRIDYQVSRYNVWAYETGRLSEIDLYSISENGDAGVAVLYEIYNNDGLPKYQYRAKMILRTKARTRFYVEDGQIKPYRNEKWTEWIYEESKADQILRNFVK